ncbi:hypothetical protein [Legionella feeleii]|uniref:Uncharacterized protein n=1 Tax=Legionella feeleii TaxID=453 RepID=A0A0W0TH08_9GAMM|nr:hypothetical protein [Legionella feeleii]KTC94838.1 hypothetical protein Lfee_2502 [Legionella feeleii]SPX59807.1 Uncharacterised protein [Legionella feeleii]
MPVLAKTPENISKVLGHYANLLDNWNGEHALSPDRSAIRNANYFWDLIQESDVDLPSVHLTEDGEINFLWEFDDNPIYLDIGFIGDGFSVYAVDIDEKEIIEEKEYFDKDVIECLLNILKLKVHLR